MADTDTTPQSGPNLTGYRILTTAEIDAINRGKEIAAGVGEHLLAQRSAAYLLLSAPDVRVQAEGAESLRWLDAAELQLQQGFMALTRAIARPTTF